MAKRKSLSEFARETQQHASAEADSPEQLGAVEPEDRLRDALMRAREERQEEELAPKPKRVNVDLDPDFYDQLQERARQEDESLSQLVREVLECT